MRCATAMATALREHYASEHSAAVGLIVQYPFSQYIVSGLKGAELRKVPPPLCRMDSRIFIQQAKSKTSFDVHEYALAHVVDLPKNGFILGSVRLVGARQITVADVDDTLARLVCLSVPGLLEALNSGYCWCWIWGDPFVFRDPLPVSQMNCASRGCVVWATTHEAPRQRLVPEAYLLSRISASQSQVEGGSKSAA
jgi:hypothetical protein